MALAKAQRSIAIPDNRFIASPLNRFQGGIPICTAHAKTALDPPSGTAELKINARKGAIIWPRL